MSKVHITLPDFAREIFSSSLSDVREANGINPQGVVVNFTFCKHCGGWVEGFPVERRVDTFRPHSLAGRRGIAYICPRCDKELKFWGAVS